MNYRGIVELTTTAWKVEGKYLLLQGNTSAVIWGDRYATRAASVAIEGEKSNNGVAIEDE